MKVWGWVGAVLGGEDQEEYPHLVKKDEHFARKSEE